MTKIRTYSEIVKIPTFEERYEYLKLNGEVGSSTFGYDRYINQNFYRSKEWRHTRRAVIVRDNGLDLGLEDHSIYGKILIHHMNPLMIEDFEENRSNLFDPEYLICVSHLTHNAIHYGDASLLPKDPVVRRPNDTSPWKG